MNCRHCFITNTFKIINQKPTFSGLTIAVLSYFGANKVLAIFCWLS